jgi:predicted RNA methylase
MRAYAIALLIGTTASFAFAQQFGPAENLGPDIPTPQLIVERMLEAGRVRPGDVVYDLGSGDGRVIITAAQKFGARAVGVEILPELCRKARERIKSLNLEDRVRVIQNSALRVDLSEATVVTMCFLTSSNEKLKPAFEKYLKDKARVISNEFPVKGWRPTETVRVKLGNMEHTIYVYEIGRTK